MFGRNDIWGGPLEIHPEDPSEDDENNDRRRDLDMAAYRPPSLDEVKQSWLLRPEEYAKKKKKKTIHKNKVFRTLLAVALLVGLIVLIVKVVPRPRHKLHLSASENYTIALHQALMFFNAQKSGRLPKDNNVSWRGDSGLKDELLGGYYDGGDASKFTFPASFAMTMLSWSVLEYRAKYEAIGELSHVKSIIKWGTDYLLKTFDSSANSTDKIASHIGVGTKENCWTRPEDIDTKRPAFECSTCPALAAETAAALAAASMVFKDDIKYSKKLVHGANIVFKFATKGEAVKYAGGSDQSSPFYNSSGYSDEFLWGGTWLYYATGNSSYLKLVTTPLLTNLSQQGRDQSVLSWDNKLPGAKLLLTRLRMFLSLGYPYEEMLGKFHRQINDIMCSYLPDFPTFKRTKGGLINLNNGKPRPLQYVVNAAFLATLYSDYLDSISQSGWSCGPDSYPREKLHKFARTQINYILGKNPQSMSYVVGFGDRFPQHVHHRGASIPSNKKKYGCEGGRKWRDSGKANPNIIVGAMVAGPDKTGSFHDVRSNYNYTEPTIAGNAGLVVALVALLGERPAGIDKNSMFYAIPPLTSLPPPPPSPWIPRL